jgi:hypothetical protein
VTEGAGNFFALDQSEHAEDRRVKRNAVQGVIFGVVSGNYGEKSGLAAPDTFKAVVERERIIEYGTSEIHTTRERRRR